MRVPTKQIDEHGDRLQIRPSTNRFIRAIYRQAKGYYKKFTVNLHDINREVTKNRAKGVYANPTLNYIRDQILTFLFIKIRKQHSAYVFKLILLPFSQEIKDENSNEKVKSEPVAENPRRQDPEPNTEDSTEDRSTQQQQIALTSQLCQNVGIEYRSEDLPKIASYGIEAVKESLKLMKKRSLTGKIHNPGGWLRSCLRKQWYLDAFNTVSVSLIEQYKRLRNYLLEELGTLPT